MSETHYSLEAQSLDWLVVITNLLNKYSGDGQLAIGIAVENNATLFNIPREAIPPEVVAKTIGTTLENVQATKGRIILRPFKSMADWPKPTVDEYGTA